MSDHHDRVLFGATSMGYLLIESRRQDRWRVFLEQGLGLHVDLHEDDELALRMDEHARRIVVTRGPAEDVTAIGWQIREDAFDAIVMRLRDRNLIVEAGAPSEARLRGVESFVRVKGPKGLAFELFSRPVVSDEPLDMLTSAFVTGPCGMGHVALTSRKPEAVRRFLQEIFDARLSDRVSQRIAGVTIDIDFLRVNARHHSVAIATPRGLRLDPIRTRIQHFNLECGTLGDLQSAYARCKKLGFAMAHEMGQHPNDGEQSFYAISPSGFEVELGWNATQVDERTWQSAHHDRISSWGHAPQKASVLHGLRENAGNFARGVLSLRSPELSPFDRETRS